MKANDHYMLQGFDVKYLKRLEELKITALLYDIYVDDITLVLQAINPGRYIDLEDKPMRYNPEHKNWGRNQTRKQRGRA